MLYFDHGSTEDDVILSSVLIYNKNKIKHLIQVSKSSSTTVLIEDAEMSKQIFWNEQKRLKNPNWRETDQLAIYKA